MIQYDYKNQAWIENGRYVKCGHIEDCKCYGKIHAGEKPEDSNEQIH